MTAIQSSLSIAPSTSIQSMDIETAMLTIQSTRANLLESQLKEQITVIQKKNEQISQFNQLLGSLNKAAASMSSDAKAGDKINYSAFSAEIKAAAQAAGVTLPTEMQQGGTWTVKLKDGTVHQVDEAGKNEAQHCKDVYWAFRSNDYSGRKAVISITENQNVTKGQLDGFVQQTKSQIDSMTNNQQMDMLRLQSLNNKRNEAFDLMTNFIKKSQENRSAIVGNTR